MKVAILSDIHGNFEALCAVVEDLLPREIDRVISLGDNIGYGPDPEKVTHMVADLDVDSVLGNHEMALLDADVYNSLNFQAQENNDRVRSMLSDESLEYYRSQPLHIRYGGMYFVHGFPPDSVTSYLFEVSDDELVDYFQQTEDQICFVGHTHRLSLLRYDGAQLFREKLVEGKHLLPDTSRYIVNAGSVGQPRDKSNHAKYLIWDSEKHELEVCFVSYEFEETVEKLKNLGFPQAYAMRLK